MDPATIALPLTALAIGGLTAFLGASVWYERKLAAMRVVLGLGAPDSHSDGHGWTEPARMVIHADKTLSPATQASLIALAANAGGVVTVLEPREVEAVPAEVVSEQADRASTAIRGLAQALAELTRFQDEGPASDRFPLDEDVELFLARALTATINILLAHQPSDHERVELAQLEAALYKFITDYGT